MTKEIHREVNHVGSLWQGVEARGIQKGIQQGIRQGYTDAQISMLESLMRNTGWPFEKAVSTLDIPREHWKRYAEQLQRERP